MKTSDAPAMARGGSTAPATGAATTTLLTDDLMREVRRLRVRTRRRVNNLLSGEYHSAFRGQGVEFAEVREYQPGDDVRAIDWNVTARSSDEGRAYIKRFSEERQLTVMLVVDRSASGAFGTGDRAKSRVGVELAAVVALAATTNSDRIGLVIFSDGIDRFVPPGRGMGQAVRVMTELLAYHEHGGATDLAGTLKFVGQVLRRRAVVFVVSDVIAPDSEKGLRLLAARHDVVAVTVADPRERELPPVGLIELRDAETGERRVIDASSGAVRRAYAGAAENRERELAGLLRRCGVDRIAVSTDRPFVRELAAYFRLRERRRVHG